MGIDGNWRTVRSRGSRKTNRAEKVSNILGGLPTKNRWEVLDSIDERERQFNYQVLGDSQIKYLGKVRQRRRKYSRTVRSTSGATIKDVVQHAQTEGFRQKDEAVVLHVGINDIGRSRSEEMITAFKTAITNIQAKNKYCIISGILPKRGASNYWYSKALGMNNRLRKLCDDTNSLFLDLWDDYWGADDLYARDGLHLSREGIKMLSNHMDEAIFTKVNFRRTKSLTNKR